MEYLDKPKGCIKNRLLRHDYFSNIDSPEKAYFLGLLFTDGSIVLDERRSPNIAIELAEYDKDILDYFKKEINSQADFYYNKRANREYGTYTFSFRSQQIADDLKKWNIVPNKTYNIDSLVFPETFTRDFVRGLIDGDGSIYWTNNAWHINFCGHSKNIVCQVAEQCSLLTGYKIHSFQESNQVHRYTWNGKEALELAKILYDNCTVSIQRKREKAQKCINKIL